MKKSDTRHGSKFQTMEHCRYIMPLPLPWLVSCNPSINTKTLPVNPLKIKKVTCKDYLLLLFVPGTGFEPAHLAAPPPEDGASTNFATWAGCVWECKYRGRIETAKKFFQAFTYFLRREGGSWFSFRTEQFFQPSGIPDFSRLGRDRNDKWKNGIELVQFD